MIFSESSFWSESGRLSSQSKAGAVVMGLEWGLLITMPRPSPLSLGVGKQLQEQEGIFFPESSRCRWAETCTQRTQARG